MLMLFDPLARKSSSRSFLKVREVVCCAKCVQLLVEVDGYCRVSMRRCDAFEVEYLDEHHAVMRRLNGDLS
jgi:hypothetical protein